MHHHGAGNDSNHDPSGKYPYDDDPYSPPTHPTNTNLSPLPHSLVQRFLAFARHHCQPRLLPEAAAVLKAHYLEERGKAASMAGGTATSDRLITPRYLQSLIRLSSARAKVELRNEVTESDAAYAVRLMQGCLCTLRPHSAGFGSSVSVSGGSGVLHGLNVAPVEHQAGGAGRGKRKNQREMVIDRLKVVLVQQHERRTEDTGCSHGPPHTLTRRTILDVCDEVGCKDANAMLRQLNEYGILLQTGDKFVLRGV